MADQFEKPDIDFRVTLRNAVRLQDFITFEATPDLIETRNVNYKTIDPVHAPGQILAYQNTASRNFNLSSVRLISRTELEAQQNLDRLWLLRSWTMPQFGKSTLGDSQRDRREADDRLNKFLAERVRKGEITQRDADAQRRDFLGINERDFGSRGRENRGRPPAVLLLSAYSRDSAAPSRQTPGGRNTETGHINRVPVVIQNISIPYPSDMDYIPTQRTRVPMPTIMTIDMTLMETHSPREYERFDLLSFKQGKLASF